MQAIAIFNTESGSVKSMDMADVCRHLTHCFSENKRHVDYEMVEPSKLPVAIENACKSGTYELIIVCGGDGTASLAASLCHEYDRTLGLLPGGTMNLFARSLGIPLNIFDAIEALASFKVINCDISSANDHYFVHQFSVGVQAAIISARDEMSHSGQTTKMLSGLTATLSVLSGDLETYNVIIDTENNKDPQEVSLLTVSNNPYGKNQLPYADNPNKGLLGIYWTDPLGKYDASMLIADILSGSWNSNPNLGHITCDEVTIQFSGDAGVEASLDGELKKLQNIIEFKIHKSALKTLCPIDFS